MSRCLTIWSPRRFSDVPFRQLAILTILFYLYNISSMCHFIKMPIGQSKFICTPFHQLGILPMPFCPYTFPTSCHFINLPLHLLRHLIQESCMRNHQTSKEQFFHSFIKLLFTKHYLEELSSRFCQKL
jgi:hypothetical protein